MTRFNVDLSKADSDYLKFLKETGKIKTYGEVIKPAISRYIAELKTLEGFQMNTKNTKSR